MTGLWSAGLWHENPALVKLLGLCPLLAISNSTINAFALGIVTLLTLLISNTLVSLLRAHMHYAIRIPLFVLVIATTVSVIDLLMQALFPALHSALGIFLPLVVTNCLIIGRAEAFASRQPVHESLSDALAMGFGFLWVIVCLGAVRELLGQGALLSDAQALVGPAGQQWAIRFFDADNGMLIAILPPGAFIVLGCLLAVKNVIDQQFRAEKTTVITPVSTHYTASGV